MKKHQKSLLALLLAAIIMVGLVFSVPALRSRFAPAKAEGSHTQTIVNRVDFTIKNTSYVFVKTGASQDFSFTVSLSAKKTEPDFYAILHSLTFGGFPYTSLIVSPDEATPAPALPDAPLPVADGKPQTATWNMAVSFTAGEALDTTAALTAVYSSGIKAEVTNKHSLNVDVRVVVIDQYPLLLILEQAEAALKTQNAPALQAAVTEGNRIITLAQNTTQTAVDTAYNAIRTQLDSLSQ